MVALPQTLAEALEYDSNGTVPMLLWILSSLPMWNIESVTRHDGGLLCVFVKLSGDSLQLQHQHNPMHLDIAAGSSASSFEVQRAAGEMNIVAAARACSQRFVAGSPSHHTVISLPLDSVGCVSEVMRQLQHADADTGSTNDENVLYSDEPVEKATTATLAERLAAQCTLVVPVYKRLSTLVQFLQHYEAVDWIQSAVLVWNNQDTPVPNSSFFREQGVTGMDVIAVPQSRNSLNNRYTVSSQHITTPCVFAVDDDDLFDLEDVDILKQVRLVHVACLFPFLPTWLSQTVLLLHLQGWSLDPNRIVGLSSYQRTHLWAPKRERLGGYVYSLVMGTGMPASMVLNSGTVYSTRFHDLYVSCAVQMQNSTVTAV